MHAIINNEPARQREELLGYMAHFLSHRIRGPIATLLGLTQLLQLNYIKENEIKGVLEDLRFRYEKSISRSPEERKPP